MTLVRFGPTRTITRDGDNYRITITPPKFMGGHTVNVMLTPSQMAGYFLWQGGGELIQNALPDLSDDDREKLLSGLDQAAFNRLFPKD